MVKKKIIVPKLYDIPYEPINILIQYDIKEVPQIDSKKIGITLYGINFIENEKYTDHFLFYKKNNITIYLQRASNVIKNKIYLKGTNIKSKIKYKNIFELSFKSLIKIDRSLNL